MLLQGRSQKKSDKESSVLAFSETHLGLVLLG
jgi:hypothetical protein